MPLRAKCVAHASLCTIVFAAASLPPANSRASEPRTHDDFYLRFGTGLGYATSSLTLEGTTEELGASGAALALEVAFGGTVAPGLVLGAGSFAAILPAVRAEGDEGSELEGSQALITVGPLISYFGPFVDYYLVPTQGFHLQASVAFAISASDYERPDGEKIELDAAGWTSTLGAGWDFWASDEWSLGALARLQYVSLSSRATDSSMDQSLWLPALLFTATYH